VRFHALDLTVREPDGMAAFFTELFAAVPDWRNEVEEVLGHDGAATIRWRGTGTHTFARQIGMLPKAGSAADRATLAAFNAAARLRRRVRRRG
jgi:hypothetical protein